MQKWNARKGRWQRLEARLLRPNLREESLLRALDVLDARKPKLKRRVCAFRLYYGLLGEEPMAKEAIAIKLRIKLGCVTSWLEDATRRLQNPYTWYES